MNLHRQPDIFTGARKNKTERSDLGLLAYGLILAPLRVLLILLLLDFTVEQNLNGADSD